MPPRWNMTHSSPSSLHSARCPGWTGEIRHRVRPVERVIPIGPSYRTAGSSEGFRGSADPTAVARNRKFATNRHVDGISCANGRAETVEPGWASYGPTVSGGY